MEVTRLGGVGWGGMGVGWLYKGPTSGQKPNVNI